DSVVRKGRHPREFVLLGRKRAQLVVGEPSCAARGVDGREDLSVGAVRGTTGRAAGHVDGGQLAVGAVGVRRGPAGGVGAGDQLVVRVVRVRGRRALAVGCGQEI